MLKRVSLLVLCVILSLLAPAGAWSRDFVPDAAWREDRARLDELQRAVFLYMWNEADPASGMIQESTLTRSWQEQPLAVGATGFGVAALISAVDRAWISREQALERLKKIVLFLRDKSPRWGLHGAFPHWISAVDGSVVGFGPNDDGADIVETALLMQGLLLARGYFNGPGQEKELRGIITRLWEDVDWNWFTNGEENGLYWHWSPKTGFSGLKILGYNECLIAYVLALSSPTWPISRKAYDYWTSGRGYQPKEIYGYQVEASLVGGGPLFLTHYSFLGLDPRRMADAFVPHGYFVRNVRQTLSNRGYCLYLAPSANQYGAEVWGLTASNIKSGYAANEPIRDSGTVAPTAALGSLAYTPHYSLQVLEKLGGDLRERVWGPYGPYDAFSLRFQWFSRDYLSIDHLPMAGLVENYRSGLFWRLLMDDADVRRGLAAAGMGEPVFDPGFPEAVLPVLLKNGQFVPDAYDVRRHPDTGLYHVPYWTGEQGRVRFSLRDGQGNELQRWEADAAKGRNLLRFPAFRERDSSVCSLVMTTQSGEEIALAIRLH